MRHNSGNLRPPTRTTIGRTPATILSLPPSITKTKKPHLTHVCLKYNNPLSNNEIPVEATIVPFANFSSEPAYGFTLLNTVAAIAGVVEATAEAVFAAAVVVVDIAVDVVSGEEDEVMDLCLSLDSRAFRFFD